MTELPDLPPPPDRDRALPPSGAAAALAAGRARRHRFLAGAGATTAVLVLATTLLLGGASSTDSLVADDPEPSATATATAAPSTAPSTGPEPSASAGTGPQPSAEPEPTGPPAPSPVAPGPQGTGAPPVADDRDEHVDEPVERDAPLQCTQAPSAQVGPVFTGGPAACGSASGGGEVTQGGQATVTLGTCQSRNTGALVFGYDGGQEVDVVVTRAGREVWRFSSTVRYSRGAHEQRIEDGRCLEWTGAWPTELADGTPAPEGRYDMTVVTTIDTVEGRRLGPDDQGWASATVDVVAP